MKRILSLVQFLPQDYDRYTFSLRCVGACCINLSLCCNYNAKLLVIRQNDVFQWVFQKNKARQIFQKATS